MSYSTIANDVVFNSPWETYPYSSGIGGAGDLHFFKKPGYLNFYKGEIPKSYVKLNVRKKLKELYPKKFPNMDTVGYAVREILRKHEIKDYISAEDRGWELSDYWATLEVVFISKEDYEEKILSKINGVTQKTLIRKKREKSTTSKNSLEVKPTKKVKIEHIKYKAEEMPSASELQLSQQEWLDIYWHKLGEERGKPLTEKEKAWNIPIKSDPWDCYLWSDEEI